MRRVTFGGAELAGFTVPGPASHVKLLLPPEGHSQVIVPTLTAAGVTWPEGPRPLVRTYTPRAVRGGESVELDVDFFLHGEGAASGWASRAQPGDPAVIAGPGKSFYPVDPAAPAHVLAADESALPALATVLDALPASSHVDAFIEVTDAQDELPLTSAGSLRVHWLHRGTAEAGKLLEETLRGVDVNPDAQFWVAGEAGAIRAIRALLLEEQYVPRARLVTRGYWRKGASDHPDHDHGDAVLPSLGSAART
jgi:NADPH-dependent ferric siderophore reductase